MASNTAFGSSLFPTQSNGMQSFQNGNLDQFIPLSATFGSKLFSNRKSDHQRLEDRDDQIMPKNPSSGNGFFTHQDGGGQSLQNNNLHYPMRPRTTVGVVCRLVRAMASTSHNMQTTIHLCNQARDQADSMLRGTTCSSTVTLNPIRLPSSLRFSIRMAVKSLSAVVMRGSRAPKHPL